MYKHARGWQGPEPLPKGFGRRGRKAAQKKAAAQRKNANLKKRAERKRALAKAGCGKKTETALAAAMQKAKLKKKVSSKS